MNLGFIGLGNLGSAIAKRLEKCGHNIIGYNRTIEKAKKIKGLTIVDSPRAVKDGADIIFLCLFDSNAVRQVLSNRDGLLEGGLEGKIVVDLTTNHFDPVLGFHELCQEAKGTYLDCPVLGSVIPASRGELTVLVSGDGTAYEQVRPVLEDIAKHIFHFNTPGLATKMKLVNNLVLGSFMATLAEAVAIAEDIGLDRKTILDILAVGGGNSLVLNAKREKLVNMDFSTHFSNALIFKDLHCLQDLAYALKRPLFTGALTKELYARTFQMGIEDSDFSSIYQVFRGNKELGE